MEFIWRFFILFAFATHFVTALPIPDDEAATIIPILRPPPDYVPENIPEGQPEQEVQPESEDATDFPILQPGSSDNHGEYEEYGIDRPVPIDSETNSESETDDSPNSRPNPGEDEFVESEQGGVIDPRFLFRSKRSAHHEGHDHDDEVDEQDEGAYDDYVVQRPIPEEESEEEEYSYEDEDGESYYEPEGNEMGVDDEIELLYPEADTEDRKKRSADQDDEEDNEEDYYIPRPIPDGISEEGDYSDEYEDGDTYYEPEGNEMAVEDEVEILYPEARKKRSADPDNYDEEVVQPSIDGGEDDTVTIEAASCEELAKKCKETGDLFACSAHRENCSNENGIEDTQINNIINCAYAGKNGKHNGKCPHLASE